MACQENGAFAVHMEPFSTQFLDEVADLFAQE
jgi:hypothetical protein